MCNFEITLWFTLKLHYDSSWKYFAIKHPWTSIPRPLSSRRDHYVAEKGEFNYADLSIYKSHVAFYLKLNVQKSREAIPLSSGRGARGEVNMTSPENYT